MELLFYFPLLLLSALLLVPTSSIRVNPEVDRLEHPALRLPLDHVSSSLSFLDVLALDAARVKFLNSRLGKNLTTDVPGGLIEGTSVNVPLNPTPSRGFSASPVWPIAIHKPLLSLSCEASECSYLKDATLNSPMCTKSDKCVYTATYGDQSFSQGFLSKDTLTFGSETLPGFVYGCGQDNNGLFGKSAGLVGLAKSSLSMLSQLSTKYGKAFSYCLPTASPLGKSGSGGYLSIGTHSISSAASFTPLLSNSRDPSLYFVKLTAISVSGKALGVAASDYNVPTIIDSGTTISRMAAPVYAALREAVGKIISRKYKLVEAFSILDACFAGTAAEISSVVPAVEMRFMGGAALKLAPHNVVLEVERGTTYLSFAGNSDIRDSIGIIGNQQQQTSEVVYDISNSRIGFVVGGCR
ncbi:cathepsin D [Salvia divinorum]|uniref:Cathepsin D n=1 Tax=Salvia divinorum TaxID=28513 RepID=A0ABD1HU09_SALDI